MMKIWSLVFATALLLISQTHAGQFKHITIDGDFRDWAGVPPAFEDPADSADSVDYATVYVANDDQYIYFRFTLNQPAQPFTSRENLFIDANNDPGLGFPFHGIGSEMLIQGGVGYEERLGGFNDGFTVDNLGWSAAPEGTGTDFEFRIARNTTFSSPPTDPVFAGDTITFVLESETPNFASAEFAPDDGGFTYTFAPAPSPATSNTVLVGFNADWQVNASGQDLGIDWREPAYDDSGWTSGKSLFGFAPDATVYPLPIQTSLAGTTWYFRTHFQWSNDPSSIILVASNYLSDGAIFYLNGAEVKRVRMPAGDIGFATAALGSPSAKGQVELTGLGTGPLLIGDNVLAVEVHQSTGDTSDLVFGTSVLAARQFPALFTDAASPADRSVGAGDPTTFSAVFVGTAPLSLQWLKDGTPIEGATNSSLTLDVVLQSDAGSYALRIANALATNTSRGAVLTVTNSPARITNSDQPADQAVTEGTAVTLLVEAVGSAPLSYQWFKGTAPVEGATNASFTIEDVRGSDAGEYHAVITNPFPSTVTSRTARLTVSSDTNSPVLLTAIGTPNQVTLTFSEPLDPGSVTALSNYSIEGLTVSGAVPDADDAAKIVLTTSAQSLGRSYSVMVHDVRDRFNNKLAANTQAIFRSSIVIDGSFGDWANVPLAFSDPEDSTDSLDYKDVYVTHDEDFFYFRVTFWRPGELADFHNNIFIDADQDPATGFTFRGIGSDVLIQSGAGYEEQPGIFNNGTVSGLDWQLAAEGVVPEVEFRVSRKAIYDGSGAPVFATNSIAFALESENAGFATRDSAPDDAGYVYSLFSPPVTDLGPLNVAKATNGEISITWDGPGRLQSRTSLSTGDWADVPNANSPYAVPAGGREAYFRLAL